MKSIKLILALMLLCLTITAASSPDYPQGENNSNGTNVLAQETNDTVSNESISYTLLNLRDFAAENPIDPEKGMAIAEIAAGENASVNLVQAAPGAILPMHYHAARDEIFYVIKGEGIMTLAGVNSTITAGSLMYIPSTTLHSVLITGNERLEGLSIFSPPFDGRDRIYV